MKRNANGALARLRINMVAVTFVLVAFWTLCSNAAVQSLLFPSSGSAETWIQAAIALHLVAAFVLMANLCLAMRTRPAMSRPVAASPHGADERLRA